MKNVASVEEIRSHFPALERQFNGRLVAYFDGPGGTQVPRSVVEAMNDYIFNHNANTHWEYQTSRETDEIIANSRQALADFLNCEPDEVVFGQNMTTLTFHLARSLGRQMRAGDEIIVTELDHHANVDTWRSLEKDRGVVIRTVPMNIETGQLELDVLPHLLNQKTKLLAIGAASNALGTINEFEKAVAMARSAGALTFVDAVHYAAHQLIDVKKIDCDFLACSAYKFYGPHIGILYGRRELLEKTDFPKLKPAPDYSPERMETGTNNHEGIAGAAAAIDFLASLAGTEGSRRYRLESSFREMHKRQHELTAMFWGALSEMKGVTTYGPPPSLPRTSTISFTAKGQTADVIAAELNRTGLYASSGDFYAATIIQRLGVNGLLRIGFACYTSDEEVDRLILAIRSIVK
jgi:cysteine desulfurase family protein (TIGR01976 family)